MNDTSDAVRVTQVQINLGRLNLHRSGAGEHGEQPDELVWRQVTAAASEPGARNSLKSEAVRTQGGPDCSPGAPPLSRLCVQPEGTWSSS